MKTSLSIFLSLLLSIVLNAQIKKNNVFFIGLEGVIGQPMGNSQSLNFIYKQKYSVQYRNGFYSFQFKLLPSDFQQACRNDNKIICGPFINTYTRELLIGRLINIKNTKGIFRLNFKTGISYNRFETPTDFIKKDCSGLFGCWGSNYKHTIKKENNLGWVINPSLEIPLFKYIGGSLSPYINFNKQRLIYGCHVGLIIGILR